MSGKFEIRQMPSGYCQIAYKPYVPDESEFDEGHFMRDTLYRVAL
jgi:hypothetical protein